MRVILAILLLTRAAWASEGIGIVGTCTPQPCAGTSIVCMAKAQNVDTEGNAFALLSVFATITHADGTVDTSPNAIIAPVLLPFPKTAFTSPVIVTAAPGDAGHVLVVSMQARAVAMGIGGSVDAHVTSNKFVSVVECGP